jgi:3-carboxy-cis,cis-muconate cycloisomerase
MAGREAAHALVERAAGEVRRSGEGLREVLECMPEVLGVGSDLAGAFDLAPAVTAASAWIDRTLGDAERVRARLSEEP